MYNSTYTTFLRTENCKAGGQRLPAITGGGKKKGLAPGGLWGDGAILCPDCSRGCLNPYVLKIQKQNRKVTEKF